MITLIGCVIILIRVRINRECGRLNRVCDHIDRMCDYIEKAQSY